ncbi:MFS transporter [Corynebacterium sp. MSK039]|nr:MFS transporter [Corynebacterium sp. MSK039]MDK8791342.1 MFS transporter [Corynebacterium sp. MSK039]
MTSASNSPIPTTVTPRAVGIWVTGVLVYVMAVLGRTSLGVVSVDALDQFQINAGQLAVFTTVQLATYAFAQIPAGLLVDRLGPRKMMLYGAVLMAVGQVLLAFTTSFPVAVAARVLVGAGDATAFLSVMRIIPAWFPLRTAPLFGQATGAVGQLGQFLSAVPFLALVGSAGWSIGFVSLGAVGLLVGIVAFVVVWDTPGELTSGRRGGVDNQEDGPGPSPMVAVKYALGNRTAWHGFFIHWSGLSLLVVFTLLWGMPIMTLGMGMDKATAGWAISASTLAMAVCGVLVGFLSARLGRSRWKAIVVGTSLGAAAWLLFFISPEPRTAAAAFVMNVVMGVVSPLANIGFDSVREECRREFVATATGLANMGGWLAGMAANQAMGIYLTLAAPNGDYTWAEFRFGWFVVLGVWALGLVGVVATRPRR